MGNRKSAATAKLMFQDGKIQEYSSPVKVSHILDQNPSWFICNADHMEFDGFVSAADPDDELEMGHLYFALPLTWLAQPLQAEDMAALAVKASLAFPNSHGGGGGDVKCGRCCFSRPRVEDDYQGPWMYASERRKVVAFGGEDGGLVEEGSGRVRSGGQGGGFVQEGSGRGRSSGHSRKLSMIPEDQTSFEMPSL